jgi:hypothetical protein
MLPTYHTSNLGPDEAESFAQVTALLRRVTSRTPCGGFIAQMIGQRYYDALAITPPKVLASNYGAIFSLHSTPLSCSVSPTAQPNSTFCVRSSRRTQICCSTSLKAKSFSTLVSRASCYFPAPRTERNVPRTSSQKSCGCSHAAKWPPTSCFL